MTLRVDSITDEYTLTIPETFCNQLDWYEGSDVIILMYTNKETIYDTLSNNKSYELQSLSYKNCVTH